MTEKAVRQLRTNFEKLGARLGENLAGQSYPSALLCIERVGKVSFSDPRRGRLGRRREQRRDQREERGYWQVLRHHLGAGRLVR